MKSQPVYIVTKIIAILILLVLIYGVISVKNTGINVSDIFTRLFGIIQQGVASFLQESRMLFR